MSLQDLLVELLHRICHYCLNDIPSIRLTSRLFATVAAEHLLPEATVYFARESFDNLRAIAASHSVARGLRTLCFQADRLPRLTNYDAWYTERFSFDPDAQSRLRDALDMEPTSPEPDLSTDRASRLFQRKIKRSESIRKGRFTKAKLQKAYEAYQEL